MATHTKMTVHDEIWSRVERIFTEWTERLEMNYLHLVLVRSDGLFSEEAPWVAAVTESKWQYRSAKITVYIPAVANHTDDDLEGILVHELVHVLADPMESLLAETDQSERCELAVENVAHALLCLAGKSAQY